MASPNNLRSFSIVQPRTAARALKASSPMAASDGNIFTGIFCGVVLSLPFWVSGVWLLHWLVR